MKALEDDVDLRGTGLYVFFNQCDIAALRDGYTFIMCDFHTTAQDKEQEAATPSRPFLKSLDARQILNWRVDEGRLQRVTILEQHQIDRGYGNQSMEVYRCIEGDYWRLVQLIEDKGRRDPSGKHPWIEVPIYDENNQPFQGRFLGADGMPLGYCPIVPYAISSTSFDVVEAPEFLSLAQQNIRLYQSQSDYWSIIHMCCCPVPWFSLDTESMKSIAGNRGLSLGAHDVLYFGNAPGNSCGYLECSTAPISLARESAADTELAIKAQSLSNIAGDVSKTATEVRARVADLQKRLSRFGAQKESAVRNVLNILGDFSGVARQQLPPVVVAIDISSLLSDEKSIALLYQGGLLSRESAVLRLEAMGFSGDAEKELLLLEDADRAATDALVEKMTPSHPYN